MAFVSVQKIRFDDVDGAGIVYYPKFFHLCHAAFEDFFDDVAPLSYPALIRDRRRGFPTVHIETDFKAPLAYGDTAVVTLAVAKIGTKSLTLAYDIRRKRDSALCMQTQIVTAYMDLDAQEALPIPDDLRKIFGRYLKG